MENRKQSRNTYHIRERSITESYKNTVNIPLNEHNRKTIYDGIKRISPTIADELLDSKYESVTVRKMRKGLMKGGSLVLHEKDSGQKADFSKTYAKASGKISSAIYNLYENESLVI